MAKLTTALALMSGCALLMGGAWLTWVFTRQVNTSLVAQAACSKLSEVDGGVLPSSLDIVDGWGHPFHYLTLGDCYAIISYGSDDVADVEYDMAALCRADVAKRSSSCNWPTVDTLYVNAIARVSCTE